MKSEIDLKPIYDGRLDANGTSVRHEDGMAVCSTTNSSGLDKGATRPEIYANRHAVAERIALCWNACRGISDEDLVRIAAEHDADAASGGKPV